MTIRGAAPFDVGIISDTHRLLRPEVLDALEDVDLILHAGDVGPAELLFELEAVAPVSAVWGNTDDFEIRHRIPEIQELFLGGLQIRVIHGHQLGSPSPSLLAERFPGVDLVVFGHTHQPLMEKVGGCWFVNPGSCGPRRFNLPVTLVRGRIARGVFSGRLIDLA
jgi:uncharacterized protein